jgi:hypothetical protein
MKKTFIFTLALSITTFSIAALLGCASNVQSTTPLTTAGCKTFSMQEGAPNLAGISVLSSDLANMIGVQEFFLNRTSMGMASANTTIYNCTEMDLHLLFRARFAGDRGETEAPSAWRSVFVPPRGARSYGESAINAATTRVSIDIADGNRGQQQFGQPQLGGTGAAPAAPVTPGN